MTQCFRPHARSGRDRQTGFTLIELLLVLIILVVLGSLARSVFTGTQDKANISAARGNLGLVRAAIDRYRLDMNKYPSKLADLWEKPSDAAEAERWANDGYIEKLKPDPWSNEYQYRAQGEKNPGKYDFWSNGPDGQSGTDDDIGNWE
jgi:general secretion pathway protein G